ncbi:hypothetical protein [Peribacillus frigoritolerans]|uniref:hypothetical protein n=1 Tax=Peribacillus frigoritolerans TaxID=450367 RepID=UPI002E1A51C1
MDVFNCPNCNSLFVMTKFRDVCDACYKEEEAQYDKVYAYIRKKTNRIASMMQVVMETGVEERLIIKFVRTGKLRISQFPISEFLVKSAAPTSRAEGYAAKAAIRSLRICRHLKMKKSA